MENKNAIDTPRELMSWHKEQGKVDFDKEVIKGEGAAEKEETRGRYKKLDSEKAQPVPLKLHKEHRDIIDFLPGESPAETIRMVLSQHVEIKSRERKQAREILKKARVCNELGNKCFVLIEGSKELEMRRQYISDFLKAFDVVETMFSIMHFEISTIAKYLSKKDAEIIYSVFYKRERVLESQARMEKGR